jgi:hypothetical protein
MPTRDTDVAGIGEVLEFWKTLAGAGAEKGRDLSVEGIRGIMDLLGLRPEGQSSMEGMRENMDVQVDRTQRGEQDNTPVFDYLDELLLPDRARAMRHGTKAEALGAEGAFNDDGSYNQTLPIKRILGTQPRRRPPNQGGHFNRIGSDLDKLTNKDILRLLGIE